MAEVDFNTLKRHTPYAEYQIVDVVFGAAHSDFEIQHRLKPPTPEHVDYTVLRQGQSASVYHDMSATRKPWRDGVITLRSNITNARVTLLLTVSHEQRKFHETTPPSVEAPPISHTHDASHVVSGVLDDARVGAHVAADADTIPKRDGWGNIYAAHLISTDNVQASDPLYLMGKISGENWHRSFGQANVRSFLGLGSAAYLNASENADAGTVVKRVAGGYIHNNYINTSDDVPASDPTYLVGKFGDNYHRSANSNRARRFIDGTRGVAKLLRNGGAQTVGGSGAAVWVIYDTWAHNPTPQHAYNNTWLYFPAAGYYYVSAGVRWQNANEGGMRALRIWKNQGAELVSEAIGLGGYSLTGNIARSHHCGGIVYINPATDYIGVWIYTEGNVASMNIEYAELSSFLIREYP